MAAIETIKNGEQAGLLDRERIIAEAGFNRWLVPPAALAIHLCIGMAYGFSVFWIPLSRAIGVQKYVACPEPSLISSHLLYLHAGRRFRVSASTSPLAARGLGTTRPRHQVDDHPWSRPPARRAQNPTVLADLGRAVPQCERGHRRHRHGLPYAAGDLRWLAHRPSRHHFTHLDEAQRRMVATIAAAFTGLLSLFNIGGRIFWASMSDYIGRKATYYTFFLLGIALYASASTLAHTENKALFVLAFGIILSMYGGGFATVPAYLADVFGTQFVGAIHGRLLTAWSAAGIMGPFVVNYIREFELQAGVPRDSVYDVTMYVLAAMLVGGLVCNYLIKPLAEKWFMKDEEVAALQARTQATEAITGSMGIGAWRLDTTSVLAWIAVGVPIAWGVWITLTNALTLFR